MRFLIFLAILGVFLVIGPVNSIADQKKLTIVYNNLDFDHKLRTDWGFACLIQGFDKTILFDTGGNGQILLDNLQSLEIDPKEIEMVVISHKHLDHCGGLLRLVKSNPKLTVCLPRSMANSWQSRIEGLGPEIILVESFQQISEQVYTTGELGTWIKEQSLILKTDSGLIIITGCSHPGVISIVKTAKRNLSGQVRLLIGGFHLMNTGRSEIKKIVDSLHNMGVKKVAPSHCTGQEAISIFKQVWGQDCISAGCGSIITIQSKVKGQ